MSVISGNAYSAKVYPLDLLIPALSSTMRKRDPQARAYFAELNKLIQPPPRFDELGWFTDVTSPTAVTSPQVTVSCCFICCLNTIEYELYFIFHNNKHLPFYNK